MSETLSPAVALPDDASEHTTPGANGLKRRQSEIAEIEQDNKRQRTSPGKTSPTTETGGADGSLPKGNTEDDSRDRTKDDKTATRKRIGGPDEKQRSKRLFGALLGNLNQPGDRVSRRRTEIEQRKKAEVQKQDDERLEDRQRRLEKLALQRKKEQINVDEQNMHTRHKNLLNAANFLQTKTEPILYYRPWELLPDQEDRIDDQIKEAQALVDKEFDEWKEEKQTRLRELNEDQTQEQSTEAFNGGAAENITGISEPPKASAEEGVNGDANTQIPTDSEEVVKPTECPDSGAAPPESTDIAVTPTRDTGESESLDKVEETAADDKEPDQELKDDDKEREKDETEAEPKEEVEDEAEDDHVVEGDEDTVIY